MGASPEIIHTPLLFSCFRACFVNRAERRAQGILFVWLFLSEITHLLEEIEFYLPCLKASESRKLYGNRGKREV